MLLNGQMMFPYTWKRKTKSNLNMSVSILGVKWFSGDCMGIYVCYALLCIDLEFQGAKTSIAVGTTVRPHVVVFGAWNIIPAHVCEWFFHYPPHHSCIPRLNHWYNSIYIVATYLMRIVGLPRNPDGRSLTSNQRRQARWMNASPFAFKMLSARHLAAELGQVRRRCLMCCRHFIPAFVQGSLMDHCACV